MKQGWEIKKLGECFEYIKNGANIKQERGAGGIPITRIETLSGGVFNRDRLGYADIKTIDKYQSYVMESGDLLLSHINSKSYIGRVVVYVKEGNETIIHGMNLLRLKVIPDIISPFYMYYYSQTHKFKSQIANRRKDAVNQSSISVTDLKTIDVPVPPREEQERIVAELDCLSGVIEKKREQLRELDTLAQSIFYTMFGDPNTNSNNLPIRKFSTLCENFDSKRKPITAKDRIEGSIPYYGASGIVDYVEGYIFDGDYLLVSEDGANLELRHTPIAFSIKGKTWVNNHAHILKFEHYCTQVFLEYYINLLDISDIITGCAQPKLTQANLNSIDVFDISIEKQQEFAEKIEAIEKQKELIKQSITETETLFNARMDYYFN